MAHAPITLGSGGGYGSDDCTSTLDHILAGETAITKDSNNEPGVGRMTVNSLLSFSCAAYSGRRVLAKWQNPKAATGKPYSGVIIRYSTSGYPGKTGGTQIYKGAGSNTASGGQSQTYLDMPALNTTYYLSIYPYVTTSIGELTGNIINAACTTGNEIEVAITGTQAYTVPAGYSTMHVFCVGGGGSGGFGSYKQSTAGNGGGGGYTATVFDIPVTAGEVISAIVGAGGLYYTGTGGGTTSVAVRGATVCAAAGGDTGYNNGGIYGTGKGGSGAGTGGAFRTDSSYYCGGDGGSDGGNGWLGSISNSRAFQSGSKGQGFTTRRFGDPVSTLYAGAGAGGSRGARGWGGAGGAGGGANGGGFEGTGGNAVAGTGSGGGGGGYTTSLTAGGDGSSGIVLLHFC